MRLHAPVVRVSRPQTFDKANFGRADVIKTWLVRVLPRVRRVRQGGHGSHSGSRASGSFRRTNDVLRDDEVETADRRKKTRKIQTDKLSVRFGSNRRVRNTQSDIVNYTGSVSSIKRLRCGRPQYGAPGVRNKKHLAALEPCGFRVQRGIVSQSGNHAVACQIELLNRCLDANRGKFVQERIDRIFSALESG